MYTLEGALLKLHALVPLQQQRFRSHCFQGQICDNTFGRASKVLPASDLIAVELLSTASLNNQTAIE